jgi:hypothetical protein
MLEQDRSAKGASACGVASAVQFYSIELAPTTDGMIAVNVIATLCEQEGELEGMDLGASKVRTIDDALEVIRQAFVHVH